MHRENFILIPFLAAGLFAATSGFGDMQRIGKNSNTVMLQGNIHPHARSEFDVGKTSLGLPMERMVLVLKMAPDREAKLHHLLGEQQDPASPNYHRWLTPERFGLTFGASENEISLVISWLASHGFAIEEVAKGRGWISFSGTVAQVNRAFKTEIHDYLVQGTIHHANSRDPSVPHALAGLVAGPVSLHDFPRDRMSTGLLQIAGASPLSTPAYDSSHYLSPADFASIYNLEPLYNSGIDGTGQTIAIVGRTHPSSSNWSAFRKMMELPDNPVRVVVNGADPGDLGGDEDSEADLDVEWAGAVAKKATIKFVISKSTNCTDGVDLSAQYVVDNDLAPVMSTSFGQCESALGAAGNLFYKNLWAQAAAQGITSFVSSGNSGAAGCSAGSASAGSGAAVNGLASTPHNIAVGGTKFDEGLGRYWTISNGSAYNSVIGYIPEVAWNESGNVIGGSQLWATGGGVSSIYAKPSWQSAPGVPADGRRDVPDVSLSAAGHDGYLVRTQGALYAIGGTSASSSCFAGFMALVVQKTGKRQGNANVRLYQLARAKYGTGGGAIFHDALSGNNSVPSVTGYACVTGYDLSTGLGSVDATALVMNWKMN
ncbi:MAG: hypothetical protein A2075_14055 [Geobacteraceae bacterium GWC2_58_44]|nr:MAG: hypothetical protein A2075_14055 [Geobacteraceae bacterium GWC2_58_44]